MRRVTALYVAGLGLFLASFVWSWAALPPVVASHFDSNGNANGWMDHTWFLVFMAGMGVLALVVVPGLGALAADTKSGFLQEGCRNSRIVSPAPLSDLRCGNCVRGSPSH